MVQTHAGEQTRAARTLAIDPHIRRIGFCYFDAAVLLDWGVKNVRNGDPATRSGRVLVPYLVRMLDEYEPEVLLVPAVHPGGARRSVPVQETVEAIVREARRRGVIVNAQTDEDVNATFRSVVKGRLNKRGINTVLVRWFPELKPMLPRSRQLWEPEQYFTPMFHAIAVYCAWQGLPAEGARGSE